MTSMPVVLTFLKLADYHIGTLEGAATSAEPKEKQEYDNTADFLHPKQWKPVTLVQIRKVSHDSRVFRFKLHGDDQPFGLPTGN